MKVDDRPQELCHRNCIETLVGHDHLRQPSRIAIHRRSLAAPPACVLTYVNGSEEKRRRGGAPPRRRVRVPRAGVVSGGVVAHRAVASGRRTDQRRSATFTGDPHQHAADGDCVAVRYRRPQGSDQVGQSLRLQSRFGGLHDLRVG
ncbi:MAG: hypothetical protein AW07_00835 [Candidatus Accumulibacter sp. SK-11]|nr:MAG: hypothetical protein AW07_00835 [Candidatus Accumulibacter sp. SK-11]